MNGFIFPAALPKPYPVLAGHTAGLCALQPIPPGLHSVGDEGYPQGVVLHSPSPEGEATASLFRESVYFFLSLLNLF